MGDQFEPSEMKTCPMCAEEVRAAAKICRFCRHNFEAPGQEQTADSSPTEVPVQEVSLGSEPEIKRKSWTKWVSALVITALLGFGVSIGVGITRDNAILPEIKSSVRTKAWDLVGLGLLDGISTVVCTRVGIPSFMPITNYNCFVAEVSGTGFIYEVEMDWNLGTYRYSLKR